VEGKSTNWMEKQPLGNFFKLDALWKESQQIGWKNNLWATFSN
jgi:hypothetical protein